MTLVNRRHNPPAADKNDYARPRKGLILEADDADRYLIGYGVPALLDALDGMGRTRSSLDDVKAVYLTGADFEHYVTHGMWREFSTDRKENRENRTTVDYMLEKGLLRRGAPEKPDDIPRHQAAWSLAVHGRVMRCM